ncbi:MAG: anthranilate synthase component I family protein [Halarcobacter sp.]
MQFYSKELFLDQFTPVSIYEKVKNLYKDEITFLFESTINSSDGNYSFIIIGARERIWYENNTCYHKNEAGFVNEVESNPLKFLQKYYKNFDKKLYKQKAQELGIGLVDGFIGNIGYDIGKEFEPKLKEPMNNLIDQLNIPDLDLIRPNIILGFSHKTSKLVMITSLDSKKDDLDKIEAELFTPYTYSPLKKAEIIDEGKFNYTKEKFFDMVAASKEMVRSGDVFQILMSNRFIQKAKVDHLSFYRALRSKNPSPYLYFLEYENFSIAGSSPEVMIKLVDGHLLLRPIAGTRKRGRTLDKDIEMEIELINDAKERAEHLMLVDLGRNDVGRVAKPGTVKVTDLMRIERYSHVMHIVSDVEAVIDDKYDMFDLFAATFTAGTMTGAPKIRAMELIAKFEGIKRNFYSGSIAYFGFDGNMDSAITIRTTMLTKDSVIFQAGAGIVADSVPELEYLEVHNKLAANIATLKDLS